MTTNPIVLRKHLSVGNPAAEEDNEFLQNCFVDSGDFKVIADLENPKSIVLGRTGSGKSALLRQIVETQDRVIQITPDSLAMRFICHSTIIAYFESLGIKLDIFYQFLWRHVLSVELIRSRYGITNETAAKGFFSTISDKFSRDPAKHAALEYLRQWGDSFWLETEDRIKEFVSKFESKVDAGIETSGLPLSARLKGSTEFTVEERREIQARGQQIVNTVQMQQLHNVMTFLDEQSDDEYDSYYIVIDKLDENWVDDATRYKLLRALIEVTKTFRKISWVKIVMALRTDLLERVYEHTRDSGFQAEKYESLLLRLSWTRVQLKAIIDKRIEYLFKKQYSSDGVRFVDIFPNKVRGSLAFDYMLERTLMRPRDIISFVNECLEKAQGKTAVIANILSSAEGTYSQRRFEALRDEWSVDHPLLREYCSVRRKKVAAFTLDEITDTEIEDLVLTLATSQHAATDVLSKQATNFAEGRLDKRSFLREWACCLYKIGILGVKPDTNVAVQWSFIGAPTISPGAISDAAVLHVHPMVIRALGVTDDAHEGT